jgi:HK97 family phage major capsid protein/HK97 family phage prohead protease
MEKQETIKVGSLLSEDFKIEATNEPDKYKISGIAMKLNTESRNRVVYENVTFEKQLPLSNNHNMSDIIGNANIQMTGEEVTFEANLNPKISNAMKIWENIKHGDISNVSVGVSVTEGSYNDDYTQFTVTKGEIVELAVVPVPGFKDAKITQVEQLGNQVVEGIEIDVEKLHQEIEEKNKEAIMAIKTLSEAYSLKSELEKRLESLKESKRAAELDLNNKSKQMTSEEKLLQADKIEGFISQTKENKSKLEDLLSTIEVMETEESRIFRDLNLENQAGAVNAVIKNDESAFLEKLQNIGQENVTGSTFAMPQTISSAIITQIEQTPSLIGLVTRVMNSGNSVVYLVGESDKAVKRGLYTDPTCAIAQNATVENVVVMMGTIGCKISITDAERNKTIPEFKQWLIMVLTETIIENLDIDLIQGSGKTTGTTPQVYGLQGIATQAQKDLGQVEVIEYDATAGLDFGLVNSLLYSTKKADTLACNRKTLGAITSIVGDSGMPIFPIIPGAIFDKLGTLNIVINDQMEDLETTAPGKPAILVGQMSAYRADFAKGTMIELGQTSIDACRNNEIYAYSDCTGSIVIPNRFAVLEGK